VPLHDRDLRPEAGCADRRDETRGACPEDDEVVALGGGRIPPARRVDAPDERAVVLVVGEDERLLLRCVRKSLGGLHERASRAGSAAVLRASARARARRATRVTRTVAATVATNPST
jgi:hypothetical protein